jgi:hypothetical protein
MTQKEENTQSMRDTKELILAQNEKERRFEIAQKIINGQSLTREEYYDALKFEQLGATGSGKYIPAYEYFKLRFYYYHDKTTDREVYAWLNLDVKEFRLQQKEKDKYVVGFGLYPSQVDRRGLTDEQIQYLKDFGFTDEEIGKHEH